MSGDITAIILNGMNRKKDLLEAIQSLADQIVQPEEIIIVDNGTTDDSIEAIRKRFPKVKIIEMGYNSGVIGFNKAAKEVKTKYLASLDDDCIFPKNWISEVLKRFEKEPETTAVITTRFIEPEMPQWYLEHPDINTEGYTYTFIMAGAAIRKDAFEDVGGFDERYFWYVLEREITAKFNNRGYRVLYYPKVKFFHKKPFSIRSGERSLKYHIRNYVWYVVRYYPLSKILKLAYHLSKNIGLGLALKKQCEGKGTIGIDKFKVYLARTPKSGRILIKAFVSALPNLPYYLWHRHPCTQKDFLKGLPYGYEGRKRFY